MNEWIKCSERMPDLKKSVLVLAKSGYYYPEVHGKKDIRDIGMHVGYFYDDHENFKRMKPKIEFMVECGCSGFEYERENLEVIYWMPLPNPPKEKCKGQHYKMERMPEDEKLLKCELCGIPITWLQ